MALVRLSRLLERAAASGHAVGYFEAWDMYSMEAVVEAAEEVASPVVFGFGGMMMDQPWLKRFGIEPLGHYGRAIAQAARVPAALILNEVWDYEDALCGVNAGFNVLMLNTCELPFAQNLELTRKLVDEVHPRGIEVQAELGRLPNFGEDAPGTLTDPRESQIFVEQTGVDFLAVSIGNVHLRTEGKARIDLDRLRAIRREVEVPLVIHGGSGFPESDIRAVIAEGVSMFHVGSLMKRRYLEALLKRVGHLDEPLDYQALVGSRKTADVLVESRHAVKQVVRDFIELFGSAGRA
ncbi:MAG TPA: class II fructose-bisphosphate aldolase [Candidatus Sumerlaeota bacterium]|nr:class II fructose-bisphosphate aldolase [Candidatus Sumerlaeota bacterium]HOR28900.1 class II fructose-bisphosphate aldolase [Candidatus Sumerlaeota bacterium]HPK01648.1 class II fructose-bisphosphate aldolase [Candidatus Sumerlaeota bacterium]